MKKDEKTAKNANESLQKKEFCSVGYRFNNTTFTRLRLTSIWKASWRFPNSWKSLKAETINILSGKYPIKWKENFWSYSYKKMIKLYKTSKGRKRWEIKKDPSHGK